MRIHIRDVDDWIVVYKDGKKVWENHSCSLIDGLDALGIPFVREDFTDEIDDLGWGKDNTDPFPDEVEDRALFVVPEGIHVERVR